MFEIKALASDADYAVQTPSFDPYVRPFFKTMQLLTPFLVEGAVKIGDSAVTRRAFYYLERTLPYTLFSSYPKPRISPEELSAFLDKYGISFGVFSRRSLNIFEKELNENDLRKCAKVVVGGRDSEDVVRKDYIPECVKRLGFGPMLTIVGSDSPPDLMKAASIGARTWLIETGYHQGRTPPNFTPDYRSRSFPTGLLLLEADLNLARQLSV